ncbi:MAG: nickel pincer cofactor biosynthesis protein LarC [Oscillospiraceae bacterium]|nr:nickel pincer cofactor biosynthesis protein LarC [Oscillospiraceae bacterium]
MAYSSGAKIHLSLQMGCAGDMLTGALFSLLSEEKQAEFLREINACGIPDCEISAENAIKMGVSGTRMHVMTRFGEEGAVRDSLHTHQHTGTPKHARSHTPAAAPEPKYYSYPEVRGIIAGLKLPPEVISGALEVYALLAGAESRVHGESLEQMHFHEVGAVDAIADICGVCLLFFMLGAAEITASAVATGFGHIKCAHGILPVPVPACCELLGGIPWQNGDVQGELLTPTGAALLKYFVTRFDVKNETLTIVKTGYGFGMKDFPKLNAVRAFWCETAPKQDEILELKCDMDDITGEEIGLASQLLLDAGALDVFTSPIFMKKQRPGVELTVLCRIEDEERFLSLIFRHTTTIGIRKSLKQRAVLSREAVTRQSAYGEIRAKVSSGYGAVREKPEFDDLSDIIKKNNTTEC